MAPVDDGAGGLQLVAVTDEVPDQGVVRPGPTQRGPVPLSGQADTISDVIAIANAEVAGPRISRMEGPVAPQGVTRWQTGVLDPSAGVMMNFQTGMEDPSSSSSGGVNYTGTHEATRTTTEYQASEERTHVLYEQQVATALIRDHADWLRDRVNRQALIDALNEMD